MKRNAGILLVFLSALLLGACSLLDKANQTLDYANQATGHLNRLSDFAQEAPQQIKEAATNPDAKKELEDRLNSMKQDIERFNGLEAPAAAKELHQQLVAKNEVLLGQINDVVNNGHLALDKLQNSQIVQTIQDAAGLIDRIQNLGL